MNLKHVETPASAAPYVPGEMSDQMLVELREHLLTTQAYSLPEASTNPVLLAMYAGSRSRQAYKNAASEAIRFLLPRAEEGTDALNLLKDLERRAGIPRHSGLVACHTLFKCGELVDQDHKFTLPRSAV